LAAINAHAAISSLDCSDMLIDCVIDANRVRFQFFMSLRDNTRRIVQCVGRRFERIQGTHGIFGESTVNVSCSLTEIFTSDLFNLDESLCRFARLEVFSTITQCSAARATAAERSFSRSELNKALRVDGIFHGSL